MNHPPIEKSTRGIWFLRCRLCGVQGSGFIVQTICITHTLPHPTTTQHTAHRTLFILLTMRSTGPCSSHPDIYANVEHDDKSTGSPVQRS